MYSRRESCSCITANVSLRLWNSRYLPQRRSGKKRVKLEGWISSVNSSAKALRRESERENSCICLFIEIDTRSSRSTQNQPTNEYRQKQNLLECSQWFIHPTNHFYWAIESLFLLQGSVGSLRWILVPDVLTFLEAFLHQKSYDVDMLGFVSTVWNPVWWRPSFLGSLKLRRRHKDWIQLWGLNGNLQQYDFLNLVNQLTLWGRDVQPNSSDSSLNLSFCESTCFHPSLEEGLAPWRPERMLLTWSDFSVLLHHPSYNCCLSQQKARWPFMYKHSCGSKSIFKGHSNIISANWAGKTCFHSSDLRPCSCTQTLLCLHMLIISTELCKCGREGENGLPGKRKHHFRCKTEHFCADCKAPGGAGVTGG